MYLEREEPETGEVIRCRLSRKYLQCEKIKEEMLEDMEEELEKIGLCMKFPAKAGI